MDPIGEHSSNVKYENNQCLRCTFCDMHKGGITRMKLSFWRNLEGYHYALNALMM